MRVGPLLKTAAGQRTIAVDRTTVAVLRQHQHRQQLLFHNTDRPWRPDGLVFTRPDARAIRPDWLTHHFTALVAASGLPPVRLQGYGTARPPSLPHDARIRPC
jgi:hypothetical protein